MQVPLCLLMKGLWCSMFYMENSLKYRQSFEKLKKSVRNIGIFVYTLGWIQIPLSIGFYIWSIFDKDFLESEFSDFSFLGGAYLTVVVSVIFIVLGSRIKKLQDKNIEVYLSVLLWISLLTLVVGLSTGSGWVLAFIVSLSLISAMSSIGRLMKIDEFSSSLTSPKYRFNKKGWIVFAIVSIVLFFIVIGFDSVIKETLNNKN